MPLSNRSRAKIPLNHKGRPSTSVLSIGGRRGGVLIGAAAALSALCSLGSQVVFERAFGVQGFAEWSYLSALLTIFVPIACMGSNHLLLSSSLEADVLHRHGLRLLLIYFGFFTLLAVAAFAISLEMSAPGKLMTVPWTLLLSIFVVQIPIVLAFPIYQRRDRAGWVAAWPLLQVALRLLVAIAALLVGFTLFGVVVIWILLSLGLVTIAVREMWTSIRRRVRGSDMARDRIPSMREAIARLVVSGIGFGLSDLLDSLDLKLVVPFAAVLFGVTETAAAGLAAVLLAAVHFFPSVLVMRILLPAVHRDTGDTSGTLRSLVLRLSAISGLALAPFAIAFLWVGFPLLTMIVRGDYSSQEQAVAWLGICFVPLCVSQVAAAPHMARRSTWRLFWWRVEGLSLFILVSLALSSFGLLAIVIGFAFGRTWLCLRVLWALGVHARLALPDGS